jgi:RNA polymerase sigma factor (sigma-70 family)
MRSESESDAVFARPSPIFATTHWSVVLAAGQDLPEKAATALEQLCRTYWHPLYGYLRRRGYSEHDAQDLTQGFVAQLLERRAIEEVASVKGKFRSFLFASLNYFLADTRDRANAQKRGGGRELVSLDFAQAEEWYQIEPVDGRNPETMYERRWAITLLDQVLEKLALDFDEAGKRALFIHLQPFLVAGSVGESYRDVASKTGLSEEAVKKAVQRMRRRYYELFREEIAQTVARPGEIEDELRHLCSVLSA